MPPAPPDVDRLFRDLARAESLDLREVSLHFRALRGRVDVNEVLSTAAALRDEGEVAVERLTAVLGEALVFLAQPADVPALERFVRCRELGPELRGEVAFAASCLGVEPESLIDDDDPDAPAIAIAPLRGMLEHLADGDAGPWLEVYRSSEGLDRDHLLATVAVGVADGILPGPLALALAPLYGAEKDAKRRGQLVAQLVADPSEASADALASWREIAQTRIERDEIRRGLRRLALQGHGPPKRSRRRTSAWMTTCDGVANYNLVISLEAAAGRDINLVYLLNLDSGLRDTSLVPVRREELEQSSYFGDEAILRVDISPGEAVKRVRAALATTKRLGIATPEGFSESEPWLEKVPVLGLVSADGARLREPVQDRAASVQPAEGEDFLSEEIFRGWYCVPDLDALTKHLSTETAEPTKTTEQSPADAPQQAAFREAVERATLRRFEREGTPELFARMLAHQAEVLNRLGRTAQAQACEASSADLLGESPLTSTFGRWLIGQSTGEAVARIRERGFAMPRGEARGYLREMLAPDEAPRRAHLMRLDLCEAAFEAASQALDELMPRERLSNDSLAGLAAAVAGDALEILGRRSGRQRRKLFTRANRDALVEKALRRVANSPVAEEHVDLLAGRMASAIVLFGQQICHPCPWQCIDGLDDPAADLYYQNAAHPAELSAGADDACEEENEPTLLSEVIDVLVAFEDLGLACNHGAQRELEALCDELVADEDIAGPLPEIDPEGNRQLAELTGRALCEAAQQLPTVRMPRDAETRAAIARFSDVCGDVLSPELFVRLLDRTPTPNPLLALLLRARRAPTLQAAQDMMTAVMNLWNHTPRSEHGGQTPTGMWQRRDAEH